MHNPTLPTSCSTEYKAVLNELIQEHKVKGGNLPKIVARAFADYHLTELQVRDILSTLNVKTFERPKGVTMDWRPSITVEDLSIKYTNPEDPEEYISCVPPPDGGDKPYVMHHTPEGYVTLEWFTKILPELEKMRQDGAADIHAHDHFKNESLSLGQVTTINRYFQGESIVGIKGICTQCFKVSLPRSGFGIRYVHAKNNAHEVRYCPGKPVPKFDSQKRPYVTHKEHGSWVCIDPVTSSPKYADVRQCAETHIPYEQYDFKKLSIRMPECECQKKNP
jgi:hypothetical protein